MFVGTGRRVAVGIGRGMLVAVGIGVSVEAAVGEAESAVGWSWSPDAPDRAVVVAALLALPGRVPEPGENTATAQAQMTQAITSEAQPAPTPTFAGSFNPMNQPHTRLQRRASLVRATVRMLVDDVGVCGGVGGCCAGWGEVAGCMRHLDSEARSPHPQRAGKRSNPHEPENIKP